MSVTEFLKPVSWEGVILQAQRNDANRYVIRRWDVRTQRWVHTDLTFDKYMKSPKATPEELAAAGLI